MVISDIMSHYSGVQMGNKKSSALPSASSASSSDDSMDSTLPIPKLGPPPSVADIGAQLKALHRRLTSVMTSWPLDLVILIVDFTAPRPLLLTVKDPMLHTLTHVYLLSSPSLACPQPSWRLIAGRPTINTMNSDQPHDCFNLWIDDGRWQHHPTHPQPFSSPPSTSSSSSSSTSSIRVLDCRDGEWHDGIGIVTTIEGDNPALFTCRNTYGRKRLSFVTNNGMGVSSSSCYGGLQGGCVMDDWTLSNQYQVVPWRAHYYITRRHDVLTAGDEREYNREYTPRDTDRYHGYFGAGVCLIDDNTVMVAGMPVHS
jgi:hypothetical protein